MKLFLLIICICITVSCRQEKKRLPEIITIPEEEPDLHTEYQQNKTFKGLFVVGRNTHTFRNCEHPEEDYFVIDSTHQMDDLYKTIFMNSPVFPFEYVYVEIKGTVQNASEAARVRGFDSAIVVNEILTFEQKNYRNTCIPYDFWALGNEPDWSLQVSAKEGILAFKDYNNQTVYLFEYFAPKVVNDEVFTYYSNNYANQTAINIVFKREPCSDGISGNEFTYSASVIINGKRYIGCGIRGGGEY